MKNLFTYVLLFCAILAYGQFDKIESMRYGTVITYFPNSCNVSVPEAAGKYTFCDGNGNLAAVTSSLGLSGKYILNVGHSLDPNIQAFTTETGISLRYSNGDWYNVPNYLLPNGTGSFGVNVEDVAVDNSNNLIYAHTSNNSLGFNTIDLNTNALSNIPFTDGVGTTFNHHTIAITVDRNTGTFYIMAGDSNTLSFYSWDGSSLNFILSTGNNVSIPFSFDDGDFTYNNNILIFHASNNIYAIDPTSTSPSLTPLSSFNNQTLGVSDLVTDNQGRIIINGNDIINGGRFIYIYTDENTPLESYEPFPNTGIGFEDIAFYQGTIFATTGDGIINRCTIDSSNQLVIDNTLDEIALAATGFAPIVNNSGDNLLLSLRVVNNTLHFYSPGQTTSRNLLEDHTMISFDGNAYDGVTSNRTESLSPAALSGASWIEPFEADIKTLSTSTGSGNKYLSSISTSTTTDTQLYSVDSNLFNNDFDLDVDGQPVGADITGNDVLVKFNGPVSFDLPAIPTSSTASIDEQLIISNSQTIVKNRANNTLSFYKNERLFKTANLDRADYATSITMSADVNGNIWFYNIIDGNTASLRRFDPVSATSQVINFAAPNPSSSARLHPTINGEVVILMDETIYVYDGTQVLSFSIPVSGNNRRIEPKFSTLGLNGNIYVAADTNGGSRGVLEFNFNFNNPVFEWYDLTFDGGIFQDRIDRDNNEILISDVSLDFNGDRLWVTHEDGIIGLTLAASDQTPVLSFAQGTSSVFFGRVYHDKNNNDFFDPGEAVTNVQVAAVNGNDLRTGFTNASGEFMVPYSGAGNYNIVIPTLPIGLEASPQFLTATVTDVDQDTSVADIKLLSTDQSAIYAQGFVKEGAWGFDNRDGFDNSFVGAISNLGTNPINNVTVTYSIENADAATMNSLPQVIETELISYTSLSDDNIYEKLVVNPRNHEVQVALDPAQFSTTVENLTPVISNNGNRIDVQYTIPIMGLRQTFTIRVKTGAYDPTQNGVVLNYGVSAISSPDLQSTAGSSYSLLPIDQNNNFIEFSSERYNYVDPFFINASSTTTNVKVFYDGLTSTSLRSSYDPNDKLAVPGIPGIVNDVSIDHKWLIYVIRFENEGNFPAQDVSIVDVLDSDLNPNTFTFLSSSHPVDVENRVENGDNVVQFNFDNINLDYTDNDATASQGYVQFAISANENIGENTLVENEADIYFDQNSPIRTPVMQHNFKTITLSNEGVELNGNLDVYPNPTSGLLRFRESGNSNILSHQVYDTMGRLMLEDQTSAQETNLESLPDGVYLLKIVTSKSTKTHKIILKR